MEVKELSLILGKIFSKITQNEDRSILFETKNGEIFKMFHEQDCCETVYIEEVIGDLQSLVNSPILVAEERSYKSSEPEGKALDKMERYSMENQLAATWTFYEIRTIKGSVTIRWIGESNGYYSRSVDLIQVS